MKKIIFLLAFIVYGLLFAEDSPLVCTGQVPWMAEKLKGEPRYFQTASSQDGILFFGDNKTVEIDKKNKIVKIWTIVFETRKSIDELTKKHGQFISSLGYTKHFYLFDIPNKRMKILASAEYRCDGNLIYNGDGNNKWQYLIPNSTVENMFEIIKKKYGL